MAKTLRGYQVDAKNEILTAFNRGVNRQMLVLATGLGKTFTAVDIIRPFKKRLWITHEESLLDQSGTAMLAEYFPNINIRDMVEAYGGLTDYIRHVRKNPLFSNMGDNDILKNVSIIKADLFGLEGEIVLASAQTLHRRLDKIPADLFDVIVCDEAHFFSSTTFKKSIDHFKPKLLLGLTATPERLDGLSLEDIFGQITFQYNIDSGIRDGYLVELDAVQIRTKLNLDNVHTLGGEFNQKELSQTVDTEERNTLMYDSYKKYADGKQAIIFCINIEHATNVNAIFKANGVLSEVLVSDTEITPDKKATLNRFKNEETNVLINVGMVTTGIDIPNVQCIITGRPTKSPTLFWQSLGRGTRVLPGVIDGIDDPMVRRDAIKKSGKPKCIVLDIVDVTSKHKLINTFTLDKKKTIEQKTFLSSERKEELIEARDRAKIIASIETDKRINLFEVPEVTYSNSARMLEPASPKQLSIIAEHGYDTVNATFTKADANKIISELPASIKQINFLRWKKYDVDSCPGLTYGQFQLAIKQIDAKEAKEDLDKLNDSIELPF
ncbi:MAG: DEAD/DEAH box helicase [Bacteroidia bacterium]|nr:DEAD/DEAH box helicase [Bacteroidia bacterium]